MNLYCGGSHILRNVSLEAELGQVTVVLGRNGVGKTALFKSFMEAGANQERRCRS